MATHTMRLHKLDKNCVINIKLKISNQFKLRIKIAKVLFKAAALVLGCGIKVNASEEEI